MSDLDVIQAIEKQIDEPLRVCELDAVMSGNSRCSYVLEQQQVIALNLQNCKQTDLALLKQLKNLTRLNLSLNQINQLTALKELEKLTQLNLQKNAITELAPLKELANLTLLNLQDNQIIELKPLRKLKNLAVLNLQANQIAELKSLADLMGLTVLNLSSNGIKDLTPLRFLKQLSSLNLSSNQILGLEPLLELAELVELDLRFNQISRLEPLHKLKKLTLLYLSSNKIIELEPLQELNALRKLFLSSNQIIELAPLNDLNLLTELDLRANQISQIEAIAPLEQLHYLYLESNQISDITSLQNLTELRQLNLRNNQISNIEALKNLKHLNQLYLSNNKIQLLPKWIVDFNLKIKWNSGGDGISVVANPLKYPPPEIIRQGNLAIKAYFDDLEQQQQRPLNEIKICFVGDSAVGKTSLIKLLCGEDFNPDEPPTQGIAIADWPHHNMTAHCWDFSGDESIQVTHNLFFSVQCLYVLVLDNRPQRHEELWLKKIECLTGGVPILIVLNKCEQATSYDVNRRQLIKCYNGLQTGSFVSVSCAQKLGLDEFKSALIAGLKQVALVKRLWPESWLQVKNSVAQQLKQYYYISWQHYLQICEEQGVRELDCQQQLVQLLHDLGILVHFKKFNLLETAILDPDWITKSLYRIICSSQLADNKGLLLLKDLGAILKPTHAGDYHYSIEHYRDLINLMRNVELCFLIDKTCILVPQLLDINPPEFEFRQTDLLRFRIHYEYLNEAIMPRLIVALRDDIDNKKYWRTGVLLKNTFFNSDALVKVNYVENLIIIHLHGQHCRDYFSVIRKALRNIEATLSH
jgi:Leucine-rich repeat (LRR) protein/GTP-binding protein EngB required for normal cell division